MNRLILFGTAVAAILVASTLGPAAAIAAPRATMILTPADGPPAAAFTVGLSRLPANAAIIITWDEAEIGRGTANSRGALILVLNVPQEAAPGPHDVSAVTAEGGDVSKATFLVRSNWIQFHADGARSGANPLENSLSPGTVAGIIINYRIPTNGPIDGSPVVCDGSVVFGSADGNLYGSDIGGFTDPWLFQTRGAISGALAAVPIDPCLIVAGSADGALYGIDAATGKGKWKVAGRSPITSPMLIRGFDPQPDPPGRQIIVGDEGGLLRAFDTRGRRLWATQLDGPVVGTAAWQSVPVNPGGTGGATSDVTIQQLDPGDRIFATTADGGVYGLDPTTGAVVIGIRLAAPIAASPAVLNLSTPPDPEAPAILVGTTDGVLHALFADDLSEAWTFRTGGPITTTPAIGNPNIVGDPNGIGNPGIFVASGDGTLYGLVADARGATPAWSTPIGSALSSSPALANGVLYLGADDSRLHAVEALTGRELFASEAITSTRSSPIVVDAQVIVGTSHGELVNFALPR